MGIVRLVHSLKNRKKTLPWYSQSHCRARSTIYHSEVNVHRYAIKTSLVGGIVYYSVQEGLWSKSEDSVRLYGRIYNNMAPYVKNNIPKEVVNELPTLPSTSDISNAVKSSWNHGVMASMKFLSEAPTHVINRMQNLSKTVVDYIEQQNVSEKNQ